MRSVVAASSLALAVVGSVVGCAPPYLNPEGLLTFAPKGARGAAVVTSEGIVFRDALDVPTRVIARDPSEPWRAPIGFILPKNGRFTATSQPTVLAAPGLLVVFRSSDVRMPSWGGEFLLRVDLHAAAASTPRACQHLVAITDVADPSAAVPWLTTALSRLGACDRITVVDTRGPRVVVPALPGTHRSLALAAAALQRTSGTTGRLEAAVAEAVSADRTGLPKRLLVLSDRVDAPHRIDGVVPTLVVGPVAEGSATAAEALQAIEQFVIPPGRPRVRDVRLRLEGVPAPVHVLESSGGETQWLLDGGEVRLGDLYEGQARSEVLRVSVPAWVRNTKFVLEAEVRADDVDGGTTTVRRTRLTALYDDDLERIAESRHGDVIAYASALATMHRLHAAFFGSGMQREDILRLARLQAASLTALAHDFPDRGFAEDAQVLNALLGAVPY